MKVTSLLTKEDAAVARSESRYYTQFFGRRPKKADGIIDVELVGLAKWKKVAAPWILRIERCIEATDPGIWIISVIGLFIGIIFMDMDIHDKAPAFFTVI